MLSSHIGPVHNSSTAQAALVDYCKHNLGCSSLERRGRKPCNCSTPAMTPSLTHDAACRMLLFILDPLLCIISHGELAGPCPSMLGHKDRCSP